jgi:hypothetical protein
MPPVRELSENTKKEIRESSDEFFFQSRKIRFPNALTGIAEGDSWFDYAPSWLEDATKGDLINQLNLSKQLNLLRVARAGDTLENMVYGTKYDKDYRPEKSQFEKTLELISKHQPQFFLFSGGGNDIAGAELESFLNHADSGLELLRKSHLDYILGKIFPKIFEDLIKKTTKAAPDIQIFFHGYGHAIPDGRAVTRVAGFDFVGPWLRPAFARKRINEVTQAQEIIRTLIDSFNEMLAEIANRHSNVHYIDLRPIIDDEDWANELHLTVNGYEKVAREFIQQINRVFGR